MIIYLNNKWLKYALHRVLLCICLISSNVYATTVPWQQTDFIIDSFFEIALGFEYRQVRQEVRKWTKPVRIYVEHQVGESSLHDLLLNAHIKDLVDITWLDIRRVSSAKKANIRYFFTSQKKLPALVQRVSGKKSLKFLQSSVCMATMRTNNSGKISSAVVYIAVDQARMHSKLLSCIVEELTQVLGLPRDSDKVYPSIFNDRSTDDLLTGLDIILLKLLYDPQVRVGMGTAQLRPLLRKILRQWRTQGLIKQAALQSRSLTLCQYMAC